MIQPELVIFDCDGVLVDSERIHNRVIADVLGEFGLEMSFDQAVERFIGRSWVQTLALVETLFGHPPPPAFAARVRECTRAELERSLQPVAGVEPVLDALTMPFCVASNAGRASLTFSLQHTGLLPRFVGRLFCVEDVERPKPAPDIYLHAARCCGSEPAQCVVVEDTPTGVTAARAAGMRVLAFAGLTPEPLLRGAGAELVFRDMNELPELLGVSYHSPIK